MGAVHGSHAILAEPDTVDEVLDMIRASGGRATTSRRVLLEVLFGGSGHRTAEDLGREVAARAPEVHISTVYRNLDELERMGVVTHAHMGHGPVIYQLASRAHPHLICERCGTRIHAPDELFGHLTRTALRSFGFAVDPRHLAISGVCSQCADR